MSRSSIVVGHSRCVWRVVSVGLRVRGSAGVCFVAVAVGWLWAWCCVVFRPTVVVWGLRVRKQHGHVARSGPFLLHRLGPTRKASVRTEYRLSRGPRCASLAAMLRSRPRRVAIAESSSGDPVSSPGLGSRRRFRHCASVLKPPAGPCRVGVLCTNRAKASVCFTRRSGSHVSSDLPYPRHRTR